MAGGRPEVGGDESKKLLPYYYWNLYVGAYAEDDVNDGLAETLKKTGLKRGLFRKSRFRGDGIEVRLETEKGARVKIKLDLYATDNAEKLWGARKAIQYEIDNQKLILKFDNGYYKDGRQIQFNLSGPGS